jgi:hypothetical protein
MEADNLTFDDVLELMKDAIHVIVDDNDGYYFAYTRDEYGTEFDHMIPPDFDDPEEDVTITRDDITLFLTNEAYGTDLHFSAKNNQEIVYTEYDVTLKDIYGMEYTLLMLQAVKITKN